MFELVNKLNIYFVSEEIKARDSQIAGYRVKVNELSDKIAAQNESLQQINNEKVGFYLEDKYLILIMLVFSNNETTLL